MESLTADDPTTVGPYELLGRCGNGRLGVVYLGRSPDGTLAAVRVVHPVLASDDRFLSRLAQWIADAAATRSAAVAAVVDSDLSARRPWMATEFVTGPSLARGVASVGPLGEAAGALAIGLAAVLVDLHRRGMVHGDLKPSDVLLAGDGPRLVDVGLGALVAASEATQAGMAMGDPRFLSPEQALGEAPQSLSDVFSLAGVVVFAAQGAGPFDGPDGPPLAVVRRILGDRPVLTGVAPELADCLDPCFEKVARERCTAAELLGRLEARPVLVEAVWPSHYHNRWMREFA